MGRCAGRLGRLREDRDGPVAHDVRVVLRAVYHRRRARKRDASARAGSHSLIVQHVLSSPPLSSLILPPITACWQLRRSILLSAALNIVVFIGVGLPVAIAWGTTVSDPITLSAHWPKSDPAARALSAFLCVANFVGYCLDSVPLARWCQRRFLPSFRGGWSVCAVGTYALASLPAFAFGLLASILVVDTQRVAQTRGQATRSSSSALLPQCSLLAAHAPRFRAICSDLPDV